MYKLLIVDDETKIRNGLRTFFPWHEIGFDVVSEAANGLQALEYVDKHHVDVILTDIVMPRMTGIELAKALYERRHGAKVVFLTGHKEFEYARKALEYGVRQYLVKPTQYKEIAGLFELIRTDLDAETAEVSGAGAGIIPSDSSADKADPEDKGYHEKKIAAIEQYVADHYADASLESMSEAFHMNKHYLSKYFKKWTSVNFSDYVLSIKMRKAAELLRDYNNRSYEVALIVGYDNAKNFSRAFKQYYGKSPREYRDHPL
ncbi:response regulator [Paenibacillus sepulcri]|uniref:Response regulator n=1 Tax=Paenibacillus sepulcri TaxID=359917 RepID=A0ABS7BWT7_9BACL|nr:response regulator [Paenibacillus sepulcri]